MIEKKIVKTVRFKEDEMESIEAFLQENPALDFSTLIRLAVGKFITSPSLVEKLSMYMLVYFFGMMFTFMSLAYGVDLRTIEKKEMSEQRCSELGQSLTPGAGGPPGSQGFENKCCPGLRHVENKHACGQAYGGYAGICIACGDKKCDPQYENKCNCPKDCQK